MAKETILVVDDEKNIVELAKLYLQKFVALLASPRRGLRTILKDVAKRFLQAGLVTLAISIILALLIARSIAKPLRRMTAATEEIARGNDRNRCD